jgi:nitronate monooxygenase
MMYISSPEFVAAISNAGALGIMASAMYDSKDEFRQAIHETKSLTKKPFGVNLNLSPKLRTLNDHFVEVVLDEDVKIVETSGLRPPEALVNRIQENNVKIMHKSITVRYALMAQTVGVDAVTVSGFEAAGYIGEHGLTKLTRHADELGLTMMTMTPLANDNVLVPLLAAGGIIDGRGLLGALALGAEGVVIGTRLLLTDECPIHDDLKQVLISATEVDTIHILGSISNPVSVLRNKATTKVTELEESQADWDKILPVLEGSKTEKMYQDGDLDLGVMPCSRSIALVREVKPVAEVISDMVQEAEDLRKRVLKPSEKSVSGITPTGMKRELKDYF